MKKGTLTKICGITSSDQAIKAARSGAAFLGLILAESTVRSISPAVAKEICGCLRQYCRENKTQPPRLVGVFKDQPADLVNQIASELKLDYVQLHGIESPEFCRLIEFPLIKAITFAGSLDTRIPAAYRGLVCYLLFDRPKHLKEDRNWQAEAIELLSKTPWPDFFFAGGLNSSNVSQVIQQLSPFAVDVCSGVDIRPGLKDEHLMQEFVERVNVASSARHTCRQRIWRHDSIPGLMPESQTNS
jgi:phosphoribosylanthranilate isomerase